MGAFIFRSCREVFPFEELKIVAEREKERQVGADGPTTPLILQINWRVATGQFVGTTQAVHECQPTILGGTTGKPEVIPGPKS